MHSMQGEFFHAGIYMSHITPKLILVKYADVDFHDIILIR